MVKLFFTTLIFTTLILFIALSSVILAHTNASSNSLLICLNFTCQKIKQIDVDYLLERIILDLPEKNDARWNMSRDYRLPTETIRATSSLGTYTAWTENTEEGSQSISTVDLHIYDTRTRLETIPEFDPAFNSIRSMLWSPDESILYFSGYTQDDEAEHLVSFDVTQQTTSRVIDADPHHQYFLLPVWLQKGRILIYQHSYFPDSPGDYGSDVYDTNFYLFDLLKNQKVRPCDRFGWEFSFLPVESPDGKWLAYVDNIEQPDDYQVFVCNMETGQEIQLTFGQMFSGLGVLWSSVDFN